MAVMTGSPFQYYPGVAATGAGLATAFQKGAESASLVDYRDTLAEAQRSQAAINAAVEARRASEFERLGKEREKLVGAVESATAAKPPMAAPPGATPAFTPSAAASKSRADFAPLAAQLENYYKLPPGYLDATAGIESRWGATPDRAGSKYVGLFQIGPAAAQSVGMDPALRTDPRSNAIMAAKIAAQNMAALRKRLGREPEAWELYLTHQQGIGAGPALLTNPNASAIDVLTQAYRGNRKRAEAALTQNGGNLNMTAAQFASLWRNKYAGFGGGAPAAIAAAAPAAAPTAAPTAAPAPAGLTAYAPLLAYGAMAPGQSEPTPAATPVAAPGPAYPTVAGVTPPAAVSPGGVPMSMPSFTQQGVPGLSAPTTWSPEAALEPKQSLSPAQPLSPAQQQAQRFQQYIADPTKDPTQTRSINPAAIPYPESFEARATAGDKPYTGTELERLGIRPIGPAPVAAPAAPPTPAQVKAAAAQVKATVTAANKTAEAAQRQAEARAIVNPLDVARNLQALNANRNLLVAQMRYAAATGDVKTLATLQAAYTKTETSLDMMRGQQAIVDFNAGRPEALAQYYYNRTGGRFRIRQNANNTYDIISGDTVVASALSPQRLTETIRADVDQRVRDVAAANIAAQKKRKLEVFKNSLKMLLETSKIYAKGTADAQIEKVKAAVKKQGYDFKVDSNTGAVTILDKDRNRIMQYEKVTTDVEGKPLPKGQVRWQLTEVPLSGVPTR